MTQQTIVLPCIVPAGEIVALGVSEFDYMELYAEHHHEWIDGIVVKKALITLHHHDCLAFVRDLMSAYFSLNPHGRTIGAPFVMRLQPEEKTTCREPDLQIILKTNPGVLHETYMDGPADICIEVVSPGSVSVDYGDKLAEYEKGGVGEYWIFDPERQVSHFYRLTDAKLYKVQPVDVDGYYATPKLPHFKLHVATLWQDPLPDVMQTVKIAQEMFKKGE